MTCPEDHIGIVTGRVVAMGNTSNTEFISAMQYWVRSQPVVPFRKDIVVVDRDCPVYYVPDAEKYCIDPVGPVEPTDNEQNSNRDNSSDDAVITIIIIIVVSIVLTIILGLGLLAYGLSRKKIFGR